MSLGELISEIEKRRKEITVYAPEHGSETVEQFATKNVTVEHRRIPGNGPEGFVVIRDNDGFVSSFSLTELSELTRPPIPNVGDDERIEPERQALLEILSDTLFSSFDRRQLLATAREIENRAWRVGHGTLRVGFQTLSAFRSQVPTYTHLGNETALDIHVYARGDWSPPEIPSVTLHTETNDDIERFWFLAFDGGDDEENKCGLLAEERDPDEFYGFWTYDPEIVNELLGRLQRTAG